jgi:hypothetical protein
VGPAALSLAEETKMKRRPGRLLLSTAGRWYRGFAIHSINLALLFILINVAVSVGLAIKDERDRRRFPPPLDAIRQTHGPATITQLYPGLDERALTTLYDEWTQLTYEYESFVQFRVRPVRGAYTNVSEYGFRLNGHDAPWPPDPAAFNIFVFGGSTTFGVLLPDRQTIPAALQAHLQDACTPLAQVYNFGRPGYVSAQERALFEKLLVSAPLPRIGVFIDGLNDSVWRDNSPPRTDAVKRAMDIVETRRPWRRVYAWTRQVVSSLPLMVAIDRLRAYFRPLPQNAISPAASTGELSVEDRMRRWIVNKQVAGAVARQLGVHVLFAWQPVPAYNYDLAYHLFADGRFPFPPQTVLQEIRTAYDWLGRHRADPHVEPDLLWLADIQRAKRENLYVDAGHYTGAFAKEIALLIGDDMRRRGWLPC